MCLGIWRYEGYVCVWRSEFGEDKGEEYDIGFVFEEVWYEELGFVFEEIWYEKLKTTTSAAMSGTHTILHLIVDSKKHAVNPADLATHTPTSITTTKGSTFHTSSKTRYWICCKGG